MRTAREMSIELPIVRHPHVQDGHVIMSPQGIYSTGGNLGPAIYISPNEQRSDEEIRALFWNLDPSQAVC